MSRTSDKEATGPLELALLDEYDHKGWREKVRAIAGYDYRSKYNANGLWWQVSDLHMLSMGRDDMEPREYRDVPIGSLRFELERCQEALRTIRDGVQLGHDGEPTGELLCLDEAKMIAIAAVGGITRSEIPF